MTIRYGSEAGQLTDNTMHAVTQSAMAGHNIASLGVKGVAKRAAKDTGRALVLNHKENKSAQGGGLDNNVGGGGAIVEAMELGEEAKEVEGGGSVVMVEQAREATERNTVVPKKPRVL